MEEYTPKDIIRQKDSIKNTVIGEKYDLYKKTEEYMDYYSQIQFDKPTMNAYLIDLCIFGYFFEQQLNEMEPEERSKYTSIFDQDIPLKIPEPLKGEIKAVDVYDNYEEYLKANPSVKYIPTIGKELHLEKNEIIP